MDMSNAATTAPSTLATQERGVATHVASLRVGDYIWHRGAYRLVTVVVDAAGWEKIRLGRYVLTGESRTAERLVPSLAEMLAR